MTTQALSNRRALWNGAYYLGELRRSWANALLYGLVYFFGVNLPLLSLLNTRMYSTRAVQYGLDGFLSFEGYSVIAMLVGVWAGLGAMGYLHKRISAYHYHSMPIRREGLLLVKTAVAFTDYLIALIPNFTLATFLYLMYPHNTGIGSVLALFGYSLLAFAISLTFTMLMGTLAGTRSFHFLLTGIGAFVGPAWMLAIHVIGDTTCHYLRVQDLLDGRGLIGYVSPFTYFLCQMDQNDHYLPGVAVLVLVLLTLACFAGALALIRIRPTEGAETPVVFKPVAAVVKYAVMAPATILLGYFFGEVFSSDAVWIIFGMVSGAVLSFMLMNVLLTRNARQMFRGWVGLLVFAVAMTGATWGTAAWFNYRDTHPYAVDDVVSVNVSEYSKPERGFTLSDPEVVDVTCAFLSRYFELIEDNKLIGGNDGLAKAVAVRVDDVRDTKTYIWGLETRRIYISQTTKTGITRTWAVTLDAYAELDDLTEQFCRTIADSDEFAERYVALFASEENDLFLNRRVYENAEVMSYKYTVDSPEYQAILDELREQICYDFFQQPRVDEVGVYAGNMWFNMPVFKSQTKMIEALQEMGYTFEVEVKYRERRDETLIGLHINDDGSTETVKVTGDMVDTIYDAASDYQNCGDAFFLTRLSRTYVFQGVEGGAAINFIEGQVPQAVMALFEGAE